MRTHSASGADGRNNMGVGDAIFEDPRLVEVYDAIEGERKDLDVYVEMVAEMGARSVLDIGCGAGTFACLLASRGIDVVAVDPARASVEFARAKAGADAVRWLHGDATTLPPLAVDAAFMTGNVAQVFLTDDDWAATLRGVWNALRPGGHFVFETRDPARRAWEGWTRELTRSVLDVPGVGIVEDWGELTKVSGDYVTFRTETAFLRENVVVESSSTLRFRDRPEVEASLVDVGFQLREVRDAPDRPGLEFVFLTLRPS